MPETHFETFVRAVGNCSDRHGVLGDERLEYPPQEDYGYHATPRNALTFGSMGVDGVHYAILRVDGRIDDYSPVIQIAPMDFSESYSLLADSFIEYVAAGCGVTTAEMQRIFDNERTGQPALATFLKDHFDQSRLWEATRNRSIDEYRDDLELNP